MMNEERSAEKRKLNILILSCSTGGGHNAAGRAMEEYFRQQGQMADFPDYLAFAGQKVSDTVGRIYVKTVQKAPRVFGMVYRLGDAVSRHMKHSPVYYVNSMMAEYLDKCIMGKEYDAVIVPHLFPAETLTEMKKKGKKVPLVIAVATDYTSIPFWGETDCDYYVVPSEEVGKEFIRAGIPQEKLLPFGIPVAPAYAQETDREEAVGKIEEELPEGRKLKPGKIYLIVGGSMGAGNICGLVRELDRQSNREDNILVICGSNQQIYDKLQKEYQREGKVQILGWTDKMPLFLHAADTLFTKPGGLTSTEAATAGCPMVHIDPIPGCETANMSYFVRHGYSITAKTSEGQAAAGIRLAHDDSMRERMRENQRRDFKGDTSQKILQFIEKCR